MGQWLAYKYDGESIRLTAIIGLRTQRIKYGAAGRMALYDDGRGGVTEFKYS